MSDNKKLNEAMSFASYMDVSELRDLYYGRLDLYISFTDDGDFDRSGKDVVGEVYRPDGIIAYTINDVVARRASTPYLYGRVFRLNRDSNFLRNVRNYNETDLKEDIEILPLSGLYEKETIDEIVEDVRSNPEVRTSFERFWEITKRLAETKGKHLAGAYWRRTLQDLDYSGFEDSSGTSPFAKERASTVLILDESLAYMLDITGVQKYQRESRQRIIQWISWRVNFWEPRRDRVTRMNKRLYWEKRMKSGKLTQRIKDIVSIYYGMNL